MTRNYDKVKLLTHSSIKITGKKTVYFDPFEIEGEPHDADVIFVTHDHFDHFSPDDIAKITKEDTCLILSECMRGFEEKVEGGIKCKFVRPGGMVELRSMIAKAIPAYNRMKPFHPKNKGYVGYVLTLDDTTYYVAGDTDMTPESKAVKCDVALLPVGGKFTMDYKEAAKLVNTILPKVAIPTHYGTVAGDMEDGKRFAELADSKVEIRVMM